MKLYLEDDAFAHVEFSNSGDPCKHLSKNITWDRSGSYFEDDIVVYTDTRIPQALSRKGRNIAWLIEAMDYQPQYYNFVVQHADKFEQIWTHDHQLIDMLPNAVRLPFGGCWIDKKHWKLHPKTKQFSIIASGKNQLTGHNLRHTIIRNSQGHVDLFGHGYNPIEDKIDALRDYRYTFCIENVRKDFWFTEKLIDCFATGTMPIYWGCPSIGEFFNTDGMAIFEKLTDLPELLKTLTPEYYENKVNAMKENMKLAEKFVLAEETIPDIL